MKKTSSRFPSQECLDYANVYIVTNSIIGGAQMIGYSFAFTADFNKVPKKMFNQDEGKIECAVGNREMGFWQYKIVLISFLTSWFAAFICLWLLVLPNLNNLINHVLCIHLQSFKIWTKMGKSADNCLSAQALFNFNCILTMGMNSPAKLLKNGVHKLVIWKKWKYIWTKVLARSQCAKRACGLATFCF